MKYLDVYELAARLEVSPMFIRGMFQRGELPIPHNTERGLVWSARQIDEWFAGLSGDRTRNKKEPAQ